MSNDLNKTYDAIQSASDQQLAQMISGGSTTAPSYMILAELQRRNKMRTEASTPSAPPQMSVREQVENNMGNMDNNTMQQMNEAAPAQRGFARGGAVAQAPAPSYMKFIPRRGWVDTRALASGQMYNPYITPERVVTPFSDNTYDLPDPSFTKWAHSPDYITPVAGLDALPKDVTRKQQETAKQMVGSSARGGMSFKGPVGGSAASPDLTFEKYSDPTDYDKMKDTRSAEEMKAAYVDAYGPDAYQEMLNAVEAEKRANAEENFGTDKWLALAKAGFGLASGRNWADGISKGLEQGIGGVTDAYKTKRAADMDVQKLNMDKAQAAANERVNKGSYTVGELAKQRSDNRQVDLDQAKGTREISMANTQGANKVAEAKYNRAFDKEKLQQEMSVRWAQVNQEAEAAKQRAAAGVASSRDILLTQQVALLNAKRDSVDAVIKDPLATPEEKNAARLQLATIDREANVILSQASKSAPAPVGPKTGKASGGLDYSAFDKK